MTFDKVALNLKSFVKYFKKFKNIDNLLVMTVDDNSMASRWPFECFFYTKLVLFTYNQSIIVEPF